MLISLPEMPMSPSQLMKTPGNVEDPVSVEKPGKEAPDSVEQAGNVTLRAVTPHCDKFFENLELTTESTQGRELMQFIRDNCFFGELCWINSNGDAV